MLMPADDTDDAPHGHIDRDGLAMGVHDDLPEGEYHADPSLSSTLIREAHKSIDHYRHRLQESPDSDAMRLGRLVHCAVLEPERFRAEYLDAPEPPVDIDDMYYRHVETAEHLAHGAVEPDVISDEVGVKPDTVQGYMARDDVHALATFLADHPDYDPDAGLSDDDLDKVRRIRDAVLDHPKVRGGLLSGGHAERSHVWQWGDLPVRCRARTDYQQPFGGGTLVADLKTTSRPLGWWKRRGVWQRNGHMQAAHYIEGVEATVDTTVTHFVYVVVQTDPPFDVQIVQHPPEALERGRQQVADTIAEIVGWWRDPDQYTGSSKRIETLECPNWI